jgi:hypothetical protein
MDQVAKSYHHEVLVPENHDQLRGMVDVVHGAREKNEKTTGWFGDLIETLTDLEAQAQTERNESRLKEIRKTGVCEFGTVFKSVKLRQSETLALLIDKLHISAPDEVPAQDYETDLDNAATSDNPTAHYLLQLRKMAMKLYYEQRLICDSLEELEKTYKSSLDHADRAFRSRCSGSVCYRAK